MASHLGMVSQPYLAPFGPAEGGSILTAGARCRQAGRVARREICAPPGSTGGIRNLLTMSEKEIDERLTSLSGETGRGVPCTL